MLTIEKNVNSKQLCQVGVYIGEIKSTWIICMVIRIHIGSGMKNHN